MGTIAYGCYKTSVDDVYGCYSTVDSGALWQVTNELLSLHRVDVHVHVHVVLEFVDKCEYRM